MDQMLLLPHYYYYYYLLLALLLPLFLLCLRPSTRKHGWRLPPGPWQLPVIGNLHHLISQLPHHAMRDLSLRHGPLMLFRICERVAVVVSSAEAMREVLKAHEPAFSTRLSSPGIDALYTDGQGVIFAPYGEHWRQLRRIFMTELLSSRRVEGFRHIREEAAARLVSSLAGSPTLVNLDDRLAEFVADSAMRAMWGDTPPDRAAFLNMMVENTRLTSLFDLRDLFPSSWLVARLLPRNGGKAGRHRREMFRLMDSVLRQHEQRRVAREADERDMIDVLLRVQKVEDMRADLTPGVIRAILTDVFGAALNNSTTTLQWTMAELMRNPRVRHKAQSEVHHVLLGQPSVREVALTNLRYLKAVIKETLRLHPPSPLQPRVCVEACKILGYDVPEGTIMLSNVWAISRDPKYWKDPEVFMPERFLGDDALDFKGMDLEYMPFGMGRRICPGIMFAHANIEIALTSLLYHFDWELPEGVKPEDMDMTEVLGITVRRKAKLWLRPISCIPLVV